MAFLHMVMSYAALDAWNALAFRAGRTRPASAEDAGQIELVPVRRLDGDVVTRVRVAHHAARRIVPQYACDALARRFGSVAHNDNAGVLREPHAHAAAVVQRHPGGTG